MPDIPLESRSARKPRSRLRFSRRTLFVLYTLFAVLTVTVTVQVLQRNARHQITIQQQLRHLDIIVSRQQYEPEWYERFPGSSSRLGPGQVEFSYNWMYKFYRPAKHQQIIQQLKELQNIEKVTLDQDIPPDIQGILLSFPDLKELELNLQWHHQPGLGALASQASLQKLSISDIGDSELAQLQKLTHLKTLVISGSAWVSDAGLQNLASCVELEMLQIWNCPRLTGQGLQYLAVLPKLSHLSVWEEFGDNQLTYLPGLTQLKTLNLAGSQVTPAGEAWLRKNLPQVQVIK